MANGLPPEGGTSNPSEGNGPLPFVAKLRACRVVAVHLAISIPLAVILNIRLDEGYTLQTTGNGLRYAWTQALRFELQPPLFFALLSLWRLINSSIISARIFSVICAALTVRVSLGLARRYLPDVPPWVVGLICAVHPLVVWCAEDIRVYAFALLLSALLLLLFYDGYLVDDGPGWTRWAYLLVALLALYTQYYLGFLLLANAVALVVQRRWRPLRAYVWGMIGVGVLFLPMLPAVYRQFFAHTKDVTLYDDFWTTLNDFLWIVKGHILPAESTKFESVRRWVQFGGLPVLAVLVVLNRRRMSLSKFGPIWTITLTMMPIFLYLRYRSGYDFFSPKHTVALFFPVVLSFLALIWVAGRRTAVNLWLIFFLGASLVSLYAVYHPLAKPGDWHRAANYVMKSESPNQPILFFSPTGALPFGDYYRGPNQLVPLPRAETFDTYDVERYVIHSEDELRTRINSAGTAPGKVWLVTDQFCRLQTVDFNCPLLENYVNRYYVVESDRQFYGSRVRLLRARTGSDPAR